MRVPASCPIRRQGITTCHSIAEVQGQEAPQMGFVMYAGGACGQLLCVVDFKQAPREAREHMQRYAVIGWGSLIWDLDDLAPHVTGPWRMRAGPRLPMEFARVSPKRKMGLAVCLDETHGVPCRTHVIASLRRRLWRATIDLARRERASPRRIGAVCLESGGRAGAACDRGRCRWLLVRRGRLGWGGLDRSRAELLGDAGRAVHTRCGAFLFARAARRQSRRGCPLHRERARRDRHAAPSEACGRSMVAGPGRASTGAGFRSALVAQPASLMGPIAFRRQDQDGPMISARITSVRSCPWVAPPDRRSLRRQSRL